jgi:hypothetical protein
MTPTERFKLVEDAKGEARKEFAKEALLHANDLTSADVEYLAPIAEMDAQEALAQAKAEFREWLIRVMADLALEGHEVTFEFGQEIRLDTIAAATSFAEFYALKRHYYEVLEAAEEAECLRHCGGLQ